MAKDCPTITKRMRSGFIPILFLIVIVASVAVTSTGVVLHKTGKLTSFVANVSQIFEQTELREIEDSEEIVGQAEEIQKEESGELERVRLEAEKARQEAEKAKAEADKLRLEMEAAQILEEKQRKQEAEELQRQQEIQRLAEEQRRQQELKIEQCKAEAQLRVDYAKGEFNKLYLQAQPILESRKAASLDFEKKYYECILEPTPDDLRALSPTQQNQIRESRCSYYLEEAGRLKQERKEIQQELDNYLQKADIIAQQSYSKFYSECLNKL